MIIPEKYLVPGKTHRTFTVDDLTLFSVRYGSEFTNYPSLCTFQSDLPKKYWHVLLNGRVMLLEWQLYANRCIIKGLESVEMYRLGLFWLNRNDVDNRYIFSLDHLAAIAKSRIANCSKMEIRLIYEPYKAFCRKMITREFEVEFEKPFCTNIILASEDCQLVRWEFQTNIRDFYRVEYHGKFRKKSVRICQDKNWEALEESFKKGTIEKDIEKLTIPYKRESGQELT